MNFFPCKHFFWIFFNILSSLHFKSLIDMEMGLDIYLKAFPGRIPLRRI